MPAGREKPWARARGVVRARGGAGELRGDQRRRFLRRRFVCATRAVSRCRWRRGRSRTICDGRLSPGEHALRARHGRARRLCLRRQGDSPRSSSTPASIRPTWGRERNIPATRSCRSTAGVSRRRCLRGSRLQFRGSSRKRNAPKAEFYLPGRGVGDDHAAAKRRCVCCRRRARGSASPTARTSRAWKPPSPSSCAPAAIRRALGVASRSKRRHVAVGVARRMSGGTARRRRAHAGYAAPGRRPDPHPQQSVVLAGLCPKACLTVFHPFARFAGRLAPGGARSRLTVMPKLIRARDNRNAPIVEPGRGDLTLTISTCCGSGRRGAHARRAEL